MKNEPTNAVRQVLMNELGLTRESIRSEMEKIVRDTVERHFHSSHVESLVQKTIDAKIQIAVNPYRYASGDLLKLVKDEVQKQARSRVCALIGNRLTINLELKDASEADEEPSEVKQ